MYSFSFPGGMSAVVLTTYKRNKEFKDLLHRRKLQSINYILFYSGIVDVPLELADEKNPNACQLKKWQ